MLKKLFKNYLLTICNKIAEDEKIRLISINSIDDKRAEEDGYYWWGYVTTGDCGQSAKLTEETNSENSCRFEFHLRKEDIDKIREQDGLNSYSDMNKVIDTAFNEVLAFLGEVPF